MPTAPTRASSPRDRARAGRRMARGCCMWRRATRRAHSSSSDGRIRRATAHRSRTSRRRRETLDGRPTGSGWPSRCSCRSHRCGRSTCPPLQRARSGPPRRATWTASTSARMARASSGRGSSISSSSRPTAARRATSRRATGASARASMDSCSARAGVGRPMAARSRWTASRTRMRTITISTRTSS